MAIPPIREGFSWLAANHEQNAYRKFIRVQREIPIIKVYCAGAIAEA
jgi:hypothetical protein